jgi:5-formyltetrahydrofolate cyclo-ligase
LDVTKKKKKLREMMEKLQKELDPEYCSKASETICQKVIDLPEYRQADTIFCFVGMKDKGEPQTKAIIEDALKQGKKVAVPLCIDKTTMNAIEIQDYESDLVPGFYGILEPIDGSQVIEPSKIDFVVVPCVTCDHAGHRLGHGNGYYDRYLSQGDMKTAMICFEKLTVANGAIPTEDHDLVIDQVITDAE